MKKPPDVIHISPPNHDTLKVNLYCLILWAHEHGDTYLLARALQRLNEL